MRWLLRLYPRPWRARYEAEFLELLHADPPSPGDLLDIAAGAFDAHLHYRRTGTGVSGGSSVQLRALALSVVILFVLIAYQWPWGLGAPGQPWLLAALVIVGLAVTAAYLTAALALLRMLREMRDQLDKSPLEA